ncbi:MAG: hypothetical protein F6K26_11660 [Moorea sp. SIO2I5]|nr:hypothetical protein [Moorena sp. SIO2I5]
MRGISSFFKGEFCVEFSPVLTIPDSRFPIPDSLKIFLQNFSKYAIIMRFLCYNKIVPVKINGKSQPNDLPWAKAGSGSHLKEIHLLCTIKAYTHG